MWDRIGINYCICIKCSTINSHTQGALFLLYKKKSMVILTGTRLNPTFFQEVSNLLMDLIKFFLYAKAVLMMILD